MNGDIYGTTLVGPVCEFRNEDQVTGRRYWQKLGDTLNNSNNKDVKKAQVGFPVPA